MTLLLGKLTASNLLQLVVPSVIVA